MPVGIMIEVPAAAAICRPAGRRGGFLQHRDQRPDPVLPGRGPVQRARGLSLQAPPPGGSCVS
ncbi:MAG: hypothetical protein MZW92_72640 [Comamonadaceae bacterium]|nr:hypothetical protein [Comamonadaceae bacterium]